MIRSPVPEEARTPEEIKAAEEDAIAEIRIELKSLDARVVVLENKIVILRKRDNGDDEKL